MIVAKIKSVRLMLLDLMKEAMEPCRHGKAHAHMCESCEAENERLIGVLETELPDLLRADRFFVWPDGAGHPEGCCSCFYCRAMQVLDLVDNA